MELCLDLISVIGAFPQGGVTANLTGKSRSNLRELGENVCSIGRIRVRRSRCTRSRQLRVAFSIRRCSSDSRLDLLQSPSNVFFYLSEKNEDCTTFQHKMRKTSLIQFARHVIKSSSSSQCRSFSAPPSNNKLFVAGLSWSVDEKSLKEAFSSFGEVSEVRIMYDKDSGRSRGFGFVNFLKEDEANSAKDAMDGKAFLGRPLKVNFALDKVNREPVTAAHSNRGATFSRSR